MVLTLRAVLILVAVLFAALAAVGISAGRVSLLAVSIGLFEAAFLVP